MRTLLLKGKPTNNCQQVARYLPDIYINSVQQKAYWHSNIADWKNISINNPNHNFIFLLKINYK